MNKRKRFNSSTWPANSNIKLNKQSCPGDYQVTLYIALYYNLFECYIKNQYNFTNYKGFDAFDLNI